MTSAQPQQQGPVVVAGGGLAGALLAVLLAKAGHAVEVYERRADMRLDSAASAGRSINLALSVRGIEALREAGIEEDILRIAIPMYGRMVHPLGGEPNFQAYSADPKVGINSVSRGELNRVLLTLAERHGAKIHFQHRCAGLDVAKATITFVDEANGNRPVAVPADRLVGCDGAFSAVRGALQRQPYFDYSQEYLSHSYKELSIPPAEGGGFRLHQHALHIWPRQAFMMIALPNVDGSFTCTLFLPHRGPGENFAALDTPEAVRAFFDRHFPDAVPHMPTLLEDWAANPVSPLLTVRCAPWAVDGVALMGDAAHAVVPFFGQGMNCAFEDCSELMRCLRAAGNDWRPAVERYAAVRKPNGDAIATMALENFIEMRDKVTDPRYLLGKEIEHAIEDRLPDYKTRYELVSFSLTPYAEAYRRGEINRRIVDELLADGTVRGAADLDWPKVEAVVRRYYSESKL